MAVFKELTDGDIVSTRSVVRQLIDVIENDVSGSSTRKKHLVFVTGGVGPGVTSSIFQTVYDQDYSLSTANAVLDFTVGLYYSGTVVQNIKSGEDSSGKLLFPSTSLMMREKIDIYRQYALNLLGNADGRFAAPYGSSTSSHQIDTALFVNVKRLFHRDGIVRDSFRMKFYQTSSGQYSTTGAAGLANNLQRTSERGLTIFTDQNSSQNQEFSKGGRVSNLVNSNNTNITVGLLFNDIGVVVLDLSRSWRSDEFVTGVIDAMSSAGISGKTDVVAGKTLIGDQNAGGNTNAKFGTDFLTSASIDNIVDHIASCRFSSGSLSSMVFQNSTVLNSTLIFCRAAASEFNYSSNPTYTDSNNRIVVIDQGQEDEQQPFAFITSVGIYDANNTLLSIGKLSRGVEKTPESELSIVLRLDF